MRYFYYRIAIAFIGAIALSGALAESLAPQNAWACSGNNNCTKESGK